MTLTTNQMAERELLGALIATGGTALDDLTLTGDDFESHQAAELYDHLRTMRARGRVIDLVTVADQAPDPVFVFGLDTVVSGGAVHAHAEIIAARALRRKLEGVSNALREVEGATVGEITEAARKLVDGAVGHPQGRVRWVKDIFPDVLKSMSEEVQFVPSPWRDLNKAIGGFRPGDVYVIGARPGVGKSVIAAQIATELSKHGGVAFSSLEMSETELVSRMIAERLSINLRNIKNNRMTDRDWDQIAARRGEVEGLMIAIDEKASAAPADVRQFARSVSRQGKLAGVVVDYLQLMTSNERAESRQAVISEFSRQMKILAKDLHVPVILLSQLNRGVEARIDNRPKLSDLRESGAIEQDATVVMLLSREENPDGSESMVMDVAKNRHGELGEVYLNWIGGFSRATDM